MVWTDIATSLEIGNYTGGAGEAATVSSDAFGAAPYDTELRSPLFDLGNDPVVTLNYLANYQNYDNLDYLDLDISSDGGLTTMRSASAASSVCRRKDRSLHSRASDRCS